MLQAGGARFTRPLLVQFVVKYISACRTGIANRVQLYVQNDMS